jgi:hypothetical protein
VLVEVRSKLYIERRLTVERARGAGLVIVVIIVVVVIVVVVVVVIVVAAGGAIKDFGDGKERVEQKSAGVDIWAPNAPREPQGSPADCNESRISIEVSASKSMWEREKLLGGFTSSRVSGDTIERDSNELDYATGWIEQWLSGDYLVGVCASRAGSCGSQHEQKRVSLYDLAAAAFGLEGPYRRRGHRECLRYDLNSLMTTVLHSEKIGENDGRSSVSLVLACTTGRRRRRWRECLTGRVDNEHHDHAQLNWKI